MKLKMIHMKFKIKGANDHGQQKRYRTGNKLCNEKNIIGTQQTLLII